jgi:response regulator of citrate/malate metabolism
MELLSKHSGPASHPLRALVLEDDIELSTVIEKVIKMIDPKIILDWATSAEEAVTHLESVMKSVSHPHYDLIVADIFLDGDSTGIDFWRSVQELCPGTPVLMTSALTLDRFFATVGRQSISPPYLQKPFTLTECKQSIEPLLGFAAHKKWKAPHSNPAWAQL